MLPFFGAARTDASSCVMRCSVVALRNGATKVVAGTAAMGDALAAAAGEAPTGAPIIRLTPITTLVRTRIAVLVRDRLMWCLPPRSTRPTHARRAGGWGERVAGTAR